MKTKLITLITLLLTVCSGAWGESASLNAFPTGTSSFSKNESGYYQWGTSVTKNTVIYDTNNRIMMWSNGNDLDQDATGLKIGNSKKKSAFVFKIAATSDISVGISYNSSDMTASLYYLGESADVLTDPNNMSPTGAISSVSISSSSSSGTLSKTGASAGYYMVFGTLRFYATSITVTASDTYTVTYKAGDGTGDDVTDDAAATVAGCPDGFTAPDGMAFAGWNTSQDGTGETYAVGASVTNTLILYAQWATAYTVTYDGNDASSGTAPTDSNSPYVEGTSVTVLSNSGSLAKSGYGFGGWNTAADGSGISYSEGDTFDMPAENVTLYAEWVTYDYTFTPKTVESDEPISDAAEIATSTGGKMTKDGGTIKYTTSGLSFESGSSSVVTVTLDKLMQAGTVITATMYYGGTNPNRGLYLANSSGTNKATWSFTADSQDHEFSYTVVEGDGLAGSKVFKLKRINNVYLKSVTVVNCVQPVTITPAYDKTTYVTTKILDFTGVDGLKAYVATSAKTAGVTMTEVTAAVPENTPLLLVGTAGAEYTVPAAASATAPETNLLKAGDGTTVFNGTTYDYILYSDGKFYQIGSGTVATNKAYLHLDSAPSGARSLEIIFDDETTGVNEELGMKNEDFATAPVYNLNGQRVAQPTKGLYIVNGKKVVLK